MWSAKHMCAVWCKAMDSHADCSPLTFKDLCQIYLLECFLLQLCNFS